MYVKYQNKEKKCIKGQKAEKKNMYVRCQGKEKKDVRKVLEQRKKNDHCLIAQIF